ncbi:MAG: hypothetical protein QGF53_15545 [Alphaproteobacteria bacterium]|nr:hypothetical protein [Alphaproteobacteria bacterium]
MEGTIGIVGENIEVAQPGETFELPNGQVYSTLASKRVHLDISDGNPFDKAISWCSESCTIEADGSGGGKWHPGAMATSGFANPSWDGTITMKWTVRPFHA